MARGERQRDGRHRDGRGGGVLGRVGRGHDGVTRGGVAREGVTREGVTREGVTRGGERGAVTAEFAVALPVVILLLAAMLTIAAASGAQLRALDAARAGARAVAIGQSDAQVQDVVGRLGGADARMTLTRNGEWVTVGVSTPVVGGWFSRVPLQASGSATAWIEP